MTQKEKVINHINRWGSITQPEASRQYSITRLAAVIHEINRDKPEHAMASTGHAEADGFAVYSPDVRVRAGCILDKVVRDLEAATGVTCLVKILSQGLLSLSRLAEQEGDITHVGFASEGTVREVRKQEQQGDLH